MSKQKIQGLAAFELLEGLDDDMILAASLPEAAPVPVPTKGERVAAFLGRMGRRGVAAAIVTVAAALAVLVGVALAGRIGTVDPPDTDPSHGIQGNQTHESGSVSDTGNGILIPPLEQDSAQETGAVAVVSDGITVYPKGYCVYISEMRRNEEGELVGVDGDGFGAVYQLAEIWDALPVLRTAGNDFDLVLPDNMTLRSIRVFEMVEVQTKTFEELTITESDLNLSADPMGCLSRLNGFYTVVLEIYHETNYSADEYTKGVDEYAFHLTVDRSMNSTAPVRVIHGDKTYFLTGYLLEESYYDAELQQEVTKRYDGATYQLQALIPDMVTATVIRRDSITSEDALSLYLAPFYDLREITVYDERLDEISKARSTEPLEILHSWGAGDYYVIISAVFAGTGMTEVTEFPIHIRVVETTIKDTTYPNDDGELPDTPSETEPPIASPETNPRVVVSGGGQTAVFETEEDGFCAWTERRQTPASSLTTRYEGTPAADVIFTDDEALRALLDMEIFFGDTLTVTLDAAGDELIRIQLYDAKGGFVASGTDFSVLDTLENDGWDRHIIVILETLAVVSPTECVCYEYAFELVIRQP